MFKKKKNKIKGRAIITTPVPSSSSRVVTHTAASNSTHLTALTLDQLPEEILLNVFSYLHPDKNLQNLQNLKTFVGLSRVNHKFNRITKDRNLLFSQYKHDITADLLDYALSGRDYSMVEYYIRRGATPSLIDATSIICKISTYMHLSSFPHIRKMYLNIMDALIFYGMIINQDTISYTETLASKSQYPSLFNPLLVFLKKAAKKQNTGPKKCSIS